MANYSISATSLTEGQLVLVRGKLGFARLTRLIEGEALAASDARRISNGISPVGVPHTTVSIHDAHVVPKDGAALTVEEQFINERLYVPKKNPGAGKSYSIDSKGSNLPIIAIPDAGNKLVQDTSGRELAQELDVTLVLRVYKPKNYNNRGMSLDQVIVNEPVRYYGGSSSTEELAARGIVYAAVPQALQASNATVAGEAAPVESDELPAGTVIDEHGFASPSPVPQTVAEPAQPVQAQSAPVQPAQVVETPEEKLARLEAENQALKNAGSAFGPAAANPWANPAGVGIQPGQ